MEANEFTAMTSALLINHPLREPSRRAPDLRAGQTRRMACGLQLQEYHASQSAQRRADLPPFDMAGEIRMGITRHPAQSGSKGFVS
jgi:hypothetical protein